MAKGQKLQKLLEIDLELRLYVRLATAYLTTRRRYSKDNSIRIPNSTGTDPVEPNDFSVDGKCPEHTRTIFLIVWNQVRSLKHRVGDRSRDDLSYRLLRRISSGYPVSGLIPEVSQLH